MKKKQKYRDLKMGFALYICMLIHMCNDEFLLPSLGILLYLIDTQYAWIKWYCVLGD